MIADEIISCNSDFTTILYYIYLYYFSRQILNTWNIKCFNTSIVEKNISLKSVEDTLGTEKREISVLLLNTYVFPL